MLTFQIREENSDNVVGYVVIKHKVGDFLNDGLDELVYPEGAYGLTLMAVLPSYRSMSLGTLLVFIAISEVQANGGRHLYLKNPLSDVYGFYIQLGFHPDPDGVDKRRQKFDDATSLPWLSESFLFAVKLQIGRSYPLWRGQVDIVHAILSSKTSPVFQFYQPH